MLNENKTGSYACQEEIYIIKVQNNMGKMFPKRLNIEMIKKWPCDPAIPHLGMYRKEIKAGTQTDIFMSVLTMALSMARNTSG